LALTQERSSSIMKVHVLAATGGTGRLIVLFRSCESRFTTETEFRIDGGLTLL
jgi:hypothetical protein